MLCFCVSREMLIALLSCLAVSPRAARKPTLHHSSAACRACSHCQHHLGLLLLLWCCYIGFFLQTFCFSSACLFFSSLTLLNGMFFMSRKTFRSRRASLSLVVTLKGFKQTSRTYVLLKKVCFYFFFSKAYDILRHN